MKAQGYRKGKPVDVELLSIGDDTKGRPGYLERNAANAFLRMRADARAVGVILDFTTAFRDADHQKRLWKQYAEAVTSYMVATGDTMIGVPGFYDRYAKWCKEHEQPAHEVVAVPGWSNHQSGTAIDIPGNGLKRAKVFPWLEANAAKYGFKRTVSSERWHYEYRPLEVLS
jgi:LAS superfamily LD-carboxypeptidase LdcB